MKILVTGGAGYIGSATVELLATTDHEIVVFDNLSKGHRAAVHPKATFVEADLADRAAIDAVFESHSIDAVMHFAAHSLVGESMQKPMLYLGDNVHCGVNLLESMLAHNVTRFVLSSTANLFDDPEHMPITEAERIVPGSPYGESKYILERILAWLGKTTDLRYAALRYFNAAGATETRGEHHEPELHLIPRVLQVAQGIHEKISIFGDDYDTPDGSCVRDYIHISDLASAHLLALEALDGGSRTYNLGNGQGFSVKQIVDASRRITGHPIPASIEPRRPGDPATLVASSDKIRSELGWQPKYPDVEQIIETAWRWHQANPQGYPE